MKHEGLTHQIIGCAYKVYKKLARPPRLKAKPMAGRRKVMKEKINHAPLNLKVI